MHVLNEHGGPPVCLCRFGRFRYERQEGEVWRCKCVALYRKMEYGRLADVDKARV